VEESPPAPHHPAQGPRCCGPTGFFVAGEPLS
jgi:hypothetical protein